MMFWIFLASSPHDVHSIFESVETLKDRGPTIDSSFYRFMGVFTLDDILRIVALGI